MADPTESVTATVRQIRRVTRKKYSAEEKVRIVLEGLRGESTIRALCRCEGIPSNLYYRWSKEFLEAGKQPSARWQFMPAVSVDIAAPLPNAVIEFDPNLLNPRSSSPTSTHGETIGALITFVLINGSKRLQSHQYDCARNERG